LAPASIPVTAVELVPIADDALVYVQFDAVVPYADVELGGALRLDGV
jgi:hypothetical protein